MQEFQAQQDAWEVPHLRHSSHGISPAHAEVRPPRPPSSVDTIPQREVFRQQVASCCRGHWLTSMFAVP